jgi:hypothetical protein
MNRRFTIELGIEIMLAALRGWTRETWLWLRDHSLVKTFWIARREELSVTRMCFEFEPSAEEPFLKS